MEEECVLHLHVPSIAMGARVQAAYLGREEQRLMSLLWIQILDLSMPKPKETLG